MEIERKILNYYIDKIFQFKEIFIIIFGFLLLFLDYYTKTMSFRKGITFILAGTTYLLLKNKFRLNEEIRVISDSSRKYKIFIISNILFYVFLGFNFISIRVSDNYIIPLSYIFYTTMMGLFLVIGILYMPDDRGIFSKIILFEIILFALVLRLTPHFEFQNIGTDPWYHISVIKDLELHNQLTEHSLYRNFLAMHFIVLITKLIMGLNILDSMIIIGFIEVISLLFIYFVGRIVFNERVGLITALVLGISGDNIFWSYYIVPMSLGLALVMIILYLVVKLIEINNVNFKIILLAYIGLMIYTHTIASVILLLILTSVYLGHKFTHLLIEDSPNVFNYSMPIFFLVVLTSYWSYVTGYFFTEVVSIFRKIFIPQSFETSTALSIEFSSFMAQIKDVNFIIFFSLTIIGLLYVMDFDKYNKYITILVFSNISVISVMYISYLFNFIEYLMPERWWAFVYILSSVLVVKGLITIYESIYAKKTGLVIVTLIILVLFSTMITISIPNYGNPIVDDEKAVRNYFYDSEISAANTMSGYYEGVIISDKFYNNYNSNINHRSTQDIYPIVIQNRTDEKGLFLIRNYIVEHIFITNKPEKERKGWVGMSVFLNETQKTYVKSFDDNILFEKIYDNAQTTAFIQDS